MPSQLNCTGGAVKAFWPGLLLLSLSYPPEPPFAGASEVGNPPVSLSSLCPDLDRIGDSPCSSLLLSQSLLLHPGQMHHNSPGCGDTMPRECLVASASGANLRTEELDRLWKGAAAGALAGAATEFILHPLDTFKTRCQLAGGLTGLRMDFASLKTLYAGTLSGMAGAVPSSALFYMVYDTVSQKAKEQLDGDQVWRAHLAGGVVAALVSSVLRVPTEVVKTQIQSGHAYGIRKTTSNILSSTRGWKGLYAGHSAFLLRDVPFDSLQFVLYEKMQSVYQHVQQSNPLPPGVDDSVLGALAGGFAGAVTTPFDVLKSHLMVRGALGVQTRPSLRQALSSIVQTEGIKGLFRGVGPRVAWLAGGGCIFFPALEMSKEFLSIK